MNICESNDTDALKILSAVFGWIYFVSWSISFYGQIYENYKNQSVYGLSFDFINFNFTGFLCYSTYTIWGYTDGNLGTGEISIQDIVFATHALAATIVTILQIFKYYDPSDPKQTVSYMSKAFVLLIWWGFFVCVLFERIFSLYDPQRITKVRFNSIIYLGFSKVFISFIKYFPQAIYNFQRKSTVGWSIFAVVTDLIGGLFSLSQNIIDYERGVLHHWDQNHSLNMAKFALSIVCILFDILFTVQHFCLYPNPADRRESEASDNQKLMYLTENEMEQKL